MISTVRLIHTSRGSVFAISRTQPQSNAALPPRLSIRPLNIAKDTPALRLLLSIARDNNHEGQREAIAALSEAAVDYPAALDLLLNIADDEGHAHQAVAIAALSKAAAVIPKAT